MITKHPSMHEWDNIQTRSTPIGSKYDVLIIDNHPAKGNMPCINNSAHRNSSEHLPSQITETNC